MRRQQAAGLEREQRLVEILLRIGQAVAEERDLEEVVQLVADEAAALVGAQFAGFVGDGSLTAARSERLYAISSPAPPAFGSLPRPLSEILRVTLDGAAVVRLEDLAAADLRVRSYLAVPVFGDGDVSGALFFGHEEPAVFGEEAERVAAGLAAVAGLAVSRARATGIEYEASAAARHEQAALALDHMGNGVALVDDDGVVRVWNRAAERITGRAGGETVGRRLRDVLPGWQEVVPRVPLGAEERPRSLPLEIDEGELWLSVCGVELEDGVVYTFRDVTDEQQLDELRGDLITTVSHEIRTPVAAVYGAARTLLRGGLEDEMRRRLLGIVVSESERLAGLVGEILLASAIETGRLAVARDEVDLAEVVRMAVDSTEAAAGGGRLELELPAAAARVLGDPDRVGQVLGNLLENARKYGAGGGDDTVTVSVLPSEATVRVEVRDRGPGIPEFEQERIFAKFHRLAPRSEEEVGGSGLGLYISRELVLRMQGSMGVRSVAGEGATFWFELPRA